MNRFDLYSFGTICIGSVRFVLIRYDLYSFGTICIDSVRFVLVRYDFPSTSMEIDPNKKWKSVRTDGNRTEEMEIEKSIRKDGNRSEQLEIDPIQLKSIRTIGNRSEQMKIEPTKRKSIRTIGNRTDQTESIRTIGNRTEQLEIDPNKNGYRSELDPKRLCTLHTILHHQPESTRRCILSSMLYGDNRWYRERD